MELFKVNVLLDIIVTKKPLQLKIQIRDVQRVIIA